MSTLPSERSETSSVVPTGLRVQAGPTERYRKGLGQAESWYTTRSAKVFHEDGCQLGSVEETRDGRKVTLVTRAVDGPFVLGQNLPWLAWQHSRIHQHAEEAREAEHDLEEAQEAEQLRLVRVAEEAVERVTARVFETFRENTALTFDEWRAIVGFADLPDTMEKLRKLVERRAAEATSAVQHAVQTQRQLAPRRLSGKMVRVPVYSPTGEFLRVDLQPAEDVTIGGRPALEVLAEREARAAEAAKLRESLPRTKLVQRRGGWARVPA